MSRVELDQGKYRDDFEDYVAEARARETAKYDGALRTPPDPERVARDLEALLGDGGSALVRAVRAGDRDGISDEHRALFRIPTDWSDFDRARATSKERMRLSDALDALVTYLDAQEGFTQDPAAVWNELLEKRIAALEAQAKGVSAALAAAVSRCEGFGSWPVKAALLYDKGEWEKLPGVYEVKVGRGAYGTPSFTLFVTDNGTIEEVEDVLEGGDTDFFDDPTTQADYFNLVNELRKPGSSARGRTLKLYTARPTRDRARYEGAHELPANVFLSTRLDDAEGLARDLGGSEVRDVWGVRVNERHLVLTLSSGAVRHYQTVRPAPVHSMELVVPGGKTASGSLVAFPLVAGVRVSCQLQRGTKTKPRAGAFTTAGAAVTARGGTGRPRETGAGSVETRTDQGAFPISIGAQQTIRPTPVQGKTARQKRAFRIKDDRSSATAPWWLYETGPGQLMVWSKPPSVSQPGSLIARGDPARGELDLDAPSARAQSRYPGLSNKTQNNVSRDSYTIPYGDSTLAGEPRRARQLFKDLLRAGVVTGEWKLVNSPHYRSMTVGEAAAETRPDAVDQITHSTTGRVRFYHGTSKKRWEELRVRGLRPGSSTGFDPKDYVDYIKGYSDRNVYLTTSIPVAEKYATRAALRDRSAAVVVEVTVEDLTRFVIDEDAANVLRPEDVPGVNLGLGDWVQIQFGGSYSWKDEQGRWGFGDWRKLPAALTIERLFQDKTYAGLRKEKVVAYRGAIPPRNLKVIESYKPVKMKNDKKYDYESITPEEFQRGMDAVRPTVRFDPEGLRKVGSPHMADPRLMSANEREAGVTGDFARWAVANLEPMTEVEIERFLTGRLGLEIKPPRTTRPGPRFQPGDSVIVKATKHTNPATREVYDRYHGKVGRVVGASPTGVTVRFPSGEEADFPDAQKARGVGIYRHTPPFMVEGSAPVEMVYLASQKEVPADQRVVVEKYLAGGRSEQRSGNYYSGHVFNALRNASGQVYFTVFSQQRVEVDPASEAGYLPRSFNPIKGQLVYIGLLGKRPAGWAEQWEVQKAGAPGESDLELRASLIRLAHSNPELRPHLLPVLRSC